MHQDSSAPARLDSGWREPVARCVAFGLVMFLVALLCIGASRQPGSLAFIWLPNALAVATLLKSARAERPLLFVTFISVVGAANLAYGDALSLAAALGLANGIEVLVAVGLSLRRGEIPKAGVGLEQGIWVLVSTAVVAPLVAGSVAAVGVKVLVGVPIGVTLAGWWTSSSVGTLFLVPPAISPGIPLFERGLSAQERLRVVALTLAATLVSLMLLIHVNFPFAYISGVFGLMTFLYGPASSSWVGALSYLCFGVLLHGFELSLPSHIAEHGPRAFWIGGAGSLIFPYVLGLMAQALRDRNAVLAEQMAAVASARRDFEGLFEMMPDAALVVDDELVVVAANDAAHALFGYEAGDLVGRRVQELTSSGQVPDSYDDPSIEMLPGASGVVQYKSHTVGLRRDGRTFAAESHFGPAHWAGRSTSISIIRDVTQRQQLHLAVEEARNRAEEASRHKGEFLANMSHELRTPMNAVLGAAQLLQGTALDGAQRNYVDIVLRSSQSLLAILKDILDFTQVEAGRLSLESLEMKIEDILNPVAPIMGIAASDKDIEVVIELSPDLPERVVGDALRLQQILTNLVSNAVKFTPQGEVVVSVQGEPTPEGAVALRVAVRDTGIGMSADGIARIFKPFSQAEGFTARRFGGTGLGLVISRRLAELMGGRIEVVSAPGAGSTFTLEVVLPGGSSDWGPRPSAPVEGRRLLLVEDHELTARSAAVWLRAWGASVQIATHVDQALELLVAARVEGGPFDAVLMDLQLGDGRALELLAACKSGRAHIVPVVLLSTPQGQVTLSETGDVARADAVLHKPTLPTALWEALEGVLTAQPAASIVDASRVEPPRSLVGLRVLLAEDNLLNRTVAVALLKRAGASVVAVQDGRAAVDALRDGASGFDVVLMDVQMPELDGYGATRLIRQELGLSIPIIAMTAGVLSAERRRCEEAGMSDFVGKPIELQDLVRALLRHAPRVEEPALPAAAPGAPAILTLPPGVTAPPRRQAPELDLGAVLAVAGSNVAYRAAILGILRDAVEAGRAPMAEADRAWAAGRPEDAGRVYHRMRGFFGTLGASRLSALAGVAEEHISLGRLEQARALRPDLEQALAAVLEEGRAVLASFEGPGAGGRGAI